MLLVLLYGITIIYGLLFNKRKGFWVWCALVLLILTNSSDTFADLETYQAYYAKVTEGGFGIEYMGFGTGWYYLCQLFHWFGLSYRGMHGALLIISMGLIHCFIKSYPCKENTFWSLFMIFPAFVFCVQMRFFLATSIVVFALNALLKKEKFGLLKYILAVIVASLVHASSAIYLVLALVLLFDKYSYRKSIFISFFGTAAVYVGLGVIQNLAFKFLPSIRYERYFESTISQTTVSWFAQIVTIYAFSVLLAVMTYRRIDLNELCLAKIGAKKTNKPNVISFTENESNSNAIMLRLVRAIALMGLTIPLLLFDRNFHRFIEVGYIILYLLISIESKYHKMSIRDTKVLIGIAVIVLCVAAYVYTPFNTIIVPFFSFDGFHSLLL